MDGTGPGTASSGSPPAPAWSLTHREAPELAEILRSAFKTLTGGEKSGG